MNQAPYFRQRTALEAYFFAVVVFVALISLASVTLLSVQSFTPLLVFGAATLSLICSGLFLKRYGSSRSMSRPEWCVVALVIGAFALRANTAINVYGGQDPGVYTNVASYFAKHGTWLIKDQLLDELKDRPDLREYYVATTLSRTTFVPNAGWLGVMVPGIYLSDMEKNEWVAQFYPVNTIWLAIGEWLFGTEWKGIPLALFSSLTLIAAYLLTVHISSSPGAGLAAAFLLGTNAAHSYIGTSPVSEATAGLFFLSALAMMLSGFQFTSLLSFSALFLTRITGFITAPLILISLAWMVLKRKDRKAAWTGMGILIIYGVSVLWGLAFSEPYSLDIYRSKLGLSAPLLQYAPAALGITGILWISWCLLALRYHDRARALCKWFITYRSLIVISVLALILTTVAYRGYLLGFTDRYVNHRWLGKRWGMAARGKDLVTYFQSKGFEVYLLSTNDAWESQAGFVHVMKIPTIMKRIMSKRSAPTKINSVASSVRLYSLQKPQTIPDIWRKTQTYTK